MHSDKYSILEAKRITSHSIVLQANCMFGGILFLTYFVGIVGSIAGLYFCVDFIVAVIGGGLTPTVMAHSAMSLCIFLCGQISTWGFAGLGQALRG